MPFRSLLCDLPFANPNGPKYLCNVELIDKPTALDRDYCRDPHIKALKRREFGSTFRDTNLNHIISSYRHPTLYHMIV